jgi:predicted enzyme related to lactoylglutathione lyase
MPNNPICYWELASHNSEESVEFFRKVFDWNFEYDAKSTIHEMIAEPEMLQLAGGGIFTLQKAKLPFLTLYIKVEGIETKRNEVEEAGGFIVIEPFDIGGGINICLFNEPSGTTWAMLEKVKGE